MAKNHYSLHAVKSTELREMASNKTVNRRLRLPDDCQRTTSRWLVFFLALSCSWNSWCSAYGSECPSACFCDADSQYVSCVGDGTWKVPPMLPAPSERLELRNFAVSVLTEGTFEGLVALRELKLQQGQTQAVEEGALRGLAMLQRLDLSQNVLENLTSGTFRGLQQLKYLDLSSNQLVHIDGAFSGLGNLEQLNLRGNCLTQLTSYTFTGLLRAQYLNLDSNLISIIEVDAFQDLTNLAHLILSNNPLTTLSRLDFFGSRLQYIDASHVGLGRVPQSLTRFVRDLRLSRNNITKITLGDLDSYPHLSLLVLDDNAIEDVEDDALGRQEYLARLWLNGNKLKRIPLNLPPTLIALYIEENAVGEVTSYSFRGLLHLEQLFLQRNKIKVVADCAFCDLVNLRTLDLQANLIETISDRTFTNLTNLQTLDISQNPIRVLQPYCFGQLEGLRTLQLARLSQEVQFEDFIFDALKNLTTLEMYDSSPIAARVVNSTRALHGLRNVQDLNLVHNGLSYLRSDFPSFLPKLKVLRISGNSFHCDRKIQWITRWMQTSNVQFYNSYSIRCATPPALQFKPIMLLTDEDLSDATMDVPSTTATLLASLSTSLRYSQEDLQASRPASVPVPQPLHADTEELSSPYPSNYLTVNETLTTTENDMDPQPLITSASTESSTTETPMEEPLTSSASCNTMPRPEHGIALEESHESTLPSVVTGSVPNTTAFQPLHEVATQPPEETKATSQMRPDNETEQEKPTADTIPLQHTATPPLHPPEQKGLLKVLKKSAALIYPRPNTSMASNRTLSTRAPAINGFFFSKASRSRNLSSVALASTAIAICCFLLLGVLIATGVALRLRHRCFWCRKRYLRMRRSSSISYRPQKDEVNILTVSEGTVNVRTSTHTEIGNKLYYVMENGGHHRDGVFDTMLDPHLQELIPQSLTENRWRSDHVSI